MTAKRFFPAVTAVMLAACQPTPPAAETDAPPPTATHAEDAHPMIHSVNAKLDDNGQLHAAAGDASLTISAKSCHEDAPDVQACDAPVQVTVALNGHSAQVQPDSLFVNATHTFYRGPLDKAAAQAGYTALLTDLDGDGHPDLILRTGKEGSYGGASYSVYLHDAATHAYVISEELSDLTVLANTLFTLTDGVLTTSSTDGCCINVVDEYEIRNRAPVLVKRVTEDRTNAEAPVVRTERLVDGQLKEVSNAP